MFTKIVVGVDGSLSSRAALRWAVDEGRLHGAPVVAVMSWHYPAATLVPLNSAVPPLGQMQHAAELGLHELVEEELGAAAPDVTEVTLCATAAEAIAGQIEPGTLVVLGDAPHTPFGELFGRSTEHGVRRLRRCATAIVRA